MKLKDETGDKKYFTIIPNYIANHSSANDQALYLQMKKIVGEQEGVCYASEKYFKDKLKIGSKALKKSIQYLIDNKWIKEAGIRKIQTKGGVQKTNVYLVKDIWEKNIEYYKGVSESEHLNSKGVAEREPLQDKGVSESNSRGVQKEAKGVALEQQTRTYNKNYNKNYTSNDKSLQTSTNNLIELFKPLNPITYKKWYANTTQRKAVERLSSLLGDKLEIAINTVIQSKGMPYAPSITTPYQLEEKLEQLRDFVSRTKSKQNKPLVSII